MHYGLWDEKMQDEEVQESSGQKEGRKKEEEVVLQNTFN
jgi:hypothetical protein